MEDESALIAELEQDGARIGQTVAIDGGEADGVGVLDLGAIFGLGLGYIAYRLIKSVDNYQVEVLLSFALVTGGYALSQRLHVSGPIAVVIAHRISETPTCRLALFTA